MRRAIVMCLVAAGLAACGSDDDNDTPAPTANVTVTPTGQAPFTASTAVGFATTAPLSCPIDVNGTTVNAATSALGVFVTDTGGDACALVTANQERRGMGGITLFIARGRELGTPPPIGPGTYTISSEPTIDITSGTATIAGAFTFKNQPDSCTLGTAHEAESGTITITSVSGSVISGSIDGNIAGGGKISGTFTTAACPTVVPTCDGITDDNEEAPQCLP